MTINPNLTLSGADLAALLCSRVCHDVISPVGAINNGLELLDEGGADEDAMDLINKYRLQEKLDLFPDIQMHYPIEATVKEILAVA